MIEIVKVDKASEYAAKLLEFVKNCSWTDAKDHIAWMLEAWVFTDWETVFAAMSDGEIVGMCSVMKTDYYPLPDIFPWVSSVFVTETRRGCGISGRLIDRANQYAKEQGFRRTYIPTEYEGLYEKYGYTFLKEITNYGGGVDRLLVKEL